VIALVVTIAALPLLVLDLMGGHSGASRQETAVSTDVPEPSLVVAVSPAEASAPSTTAAPVTTVPDTAAATSTTVAPKPTTTTTAPRATTTTTAAPRVAAPAPPAGPVPTASEAAFLACVRQRESHGDYSVVDPTGTYMGAYQIYQGGWDAVARSLGRTDLVGVRPNTASPADQDAIALQMLRMYGRSPWGGACG
jgi:hypothetical protein